MTAWIPRRTRLAATALALMLAHIALIPLTQPTRAEPSPESECFGADNERRITGCTELLERPGLDRELRARAYASRGLGFSINGRQDDAIRDYDEAIALNPYFAVALNNRAWAHFKSGRPERGRADVERSLQLDPASQHAYDTRAHIRQSAGDAAGALRDYEMAIRFGGEKMIRLYKCGLQSRGLYEGPLDGFYTSGLRRALQVCVQTRDCDPLPPDEECRDQLS